MSLLEVKNFSLELKQDENWNPVLSSVSFSLQRGETLGVVGESGSGKSVTALSIMQLISGKISKITGGEIWFEVGGVRHAVSKIRGNRIAMIFQEPMTSLNPVIKCGKQVEEALLLHTNLSKKEAKQKTIELFADVQLSEPDKVFSKYPHELSGGQKQRVMIAMAMSCNPDILIADEPTTALDVTVQKNILELLKQLQKKTGLSIIFISHDLGVVAQIAQRVLVMYKGEIVEQGEVQTIFKNPQHPYTQSLLECRKRLEVSGETITNYKLQITNNNHLTVLPFYGLTLFNIENLFKFYEIRKKHLFETQAYFQALENINLEIYEGETLGLVGESGCGKTTLGRTMLRLIEPNLGNIFYKGINLRTLPGKKLRNLRKELQIILQDPYSSLNQRLTIGQMLIEPMKVHRILDNDKEMKKRAIELLERVGLEESHLHRYPHEFSGGQRQRIAIARALTLNPKFIVCDESVSALDMSVQAHVLNLLNDLKQEFRLTYLFISHDLSVVKYMSDRIAVMQHGKIVELNDTEVICTHPQTEYTKRLIEAIPVI
jgi:peptide/nickel transport system ATP-binding protein